MAPEQPGRGAYRAQQQVGACRLQRACTQGCSRAEPTCARRPTPGQQQAAVVQVVGGVAGSSTRGRSLCSSLSPRRPLHRGAVGCWQAPAVGANDATERPAVVQGPATQQTAEWPRKRARARRDRPPAEPAAVPGPGSAADTASAAAAATAAATASAAPAAAAPAAAAGPSRAGPTAAVPTACAAPRACGQPGLLWSSRGPSHARACWCRGCQTQQEPGQEAAQEAPRTGRVSEPRMMPRWSFGCLSAQAGKCQIFILGQ